MLISYIYNNIYILLFMNAGLKTSQVYFNYLSRSYSMSLILINIIYYIYAIFKFVFSAEDDHLMRIGKRSFDWAAPTMWNCLPNSLRRRRSRDEFKKNLRILLLNI